MNETVKLGIVLLLFTAIAGGILAFSNNITAPIIAEQEKAGSFGAFAEIFTEADDFVAIDEAKLAEITANNIFVKEVFEAKLGEETVGYAFKTRSGGYGGDITTVTGFALDGTIAGIRVTENSETPGLGTRVVEDPTYRESYVGKNAENELVVVGSPSADNEVQLLSGATVSSEGVLYGVNGAREAFVNFISK